MDENGLKGDGNFPGQNAEEASVGKCQGVQSEQTKMADEPVAAGVPEPESDVKKSSAEDKEDSICQASSSENANIALFLFLSQTHIPI